MRSRYSTSVFRTRTFILIAMRRSTPKKPQNRATSMVHFPTSQKAAFSGGSARRSGKGPTGAAEAPHGANVAATSGKAKGVENEKKVALP